MLEVGRVVQFTQQRPVEPPEVRDAEDSEVETLERVALTVFLSAAPALALSVALTRAAEDVT